ncbi:hypothetical protein J3E69DRAFT_194747 [Trichoderma sp. SZMC 28015]
MSKDGSTIYWSSLDVAFWAGPCKAGVEGVLGKGACRRMSISRKAPKVERRYGPLAEANPRLFRGIEAVWTNS